jgi:hypothetical protein
VAPAQFEGDAAAISVGNGEAGDGGDTAFDVVMTTLIDRCHLIVAVVEVVCFGQVEKPDVRFCPRRGLGSYEPGKSYKPPR